MATEPLAWLRTTAFFPQAFSTTREPPASYWRLLSYQWSCVCSLLARLAYVWLAGMGNQTKYFMAWKFGEAAASAFGYGRLVLAVCCRAELGVMKVLTTVHGMDARTLTSRTGYLVKTCPSVPRRGILRHRLIAIGEIIAVHGSISTVMMRRRGSRPTFTSECLSVGLDKSCPLTLFLHTGTGESSEAGCLFVHP